MRTFSRVGIVVLEVGDEVFERELPLRAWRRSVLIQGDALGRKSNGFLSETRLSADGEGQAGKDGHRALKEVSIALFASCLPLPSLSLALAKSAALSFLFFDALGMMMLVERQAGRECASQKSQRTSV
jgi:hypothetical protein